MSSTEIITHKGKEIVFINLADCSPKTTLTILDEAAAVIAKYPPKSVLILTDSTNATYNTEVSNAMKNFSQKNTPYVKGSAVIGVDAMRKMLLLAVKTVTKRDIRSFDQKDEALEWLTSL